MTFTYPSADALSIAIAMTNDVTHDYSLRRVDRNLICRADTEAIDDSDLSLLLQNFRACLERKDGPDDVVSSSQAFEAYGEIKTYRHLKQYGYSPVCVPTVFDQKRPDFKCATTEGDVFYVEVKSFDIVAGEFAQTAILNDGLDAAISLEGQQREGRSFAVSEQAIAPFGEKTHEGSEAKAIIETIEAKVRGNFKVGQFELGPTFAVANLDRLLVPGRQCALSPYYHQQIYDGSACLSGTLWASAYGQSGYLLLDAYEFEGKPTNGGTWQGEGYFTENRKHPAQGMIMFDHSLSSPLVYGLINGFASVWPDWSSRKTECVLAQLCDAWNCESNANGYNLANYDSRIDSPVDCSSKSDWDC